VGDRFVLEEMLKEGYSFGGEQSGHVIFREYATTGDGQLTAVQLLSVIARSGKSLSELNRRMVKYPQRMENIRVNDDGKLRFYTDHVIRDAIDEAKSFLGASGRVVVRPSGTEPLIRVMAEGESEESIAHAVKLVSDAIKNRLL
jgi:phosphoglucosamine mutase